MSEQGLRWMAKRAKEGRYQRLSAAARGVLVNIAMLVDDYGCLRVDNRPITVEEVASEWGLNLKTVESNLAKLVKSGLIVEGDGSLFLSDFSPKNLRTRREVVRGYDDPLARPIPSLSSSLSLPVVSSSFKKANERVSWKTQPNDWNPLEEENGEKS